MQHIKLVDIKNKIICGIYRISFPNGKAYIGQSQNIYKRIQEHNNRARADHHGAHEIQLCEKAIQKYGQILEFDILEEVSIEQLDNREHYWISAFHTNDRQYGYNLLDKGNVSGRRGVEHSNAAFTQEQLEEIIDLLINHKELSLIDIANKYGVEQNTILRISTGKTYINPNLHYPLRQNDHSSQRKEKLDDYFETIEDLISLKEDLQYSWWLSIENDIPSKYNIPKKILRDINNGRRFQDVGQYSYPIRKGKALSSLNKEDILNILNLLSTTKMSMMEIGNLYKVGRDTISKINKGTIYIIKNYNYPAR